MLLKFLASFSVLTRPNSVPLICVLVTNVKIIVKLRERLLFSCRSDLGRGRSEPEGLHTGCRGRGCSRGWALCCGRSPHAPFRSLRCGASLEKTEEQEGGKTSLW